MMVIQNTMEKIVKKISGMNMKDLREYFRTENLEILHSLKIHLDDIYYNSGETTLEDLKYDLLKDILKKRDPTYVPPVGATLREGDNRVELPFWMGSADKITPEEPDQIKSWTNKNPRPYILSEKLDGVSCLLAYADGSIKLYTRGDGVIGADISYLANYFNIPKLKSDIIIRGELIIPKKVFEKKYSGVYKNPRNMVSGLIGGKTSRKGLEDIHYVVYEIVGDNMQKLSDQLKILKSLGFEVVKYKKVDTINVSILENTLVEFKKESNYDMDGLIVHTDTPYDRNTSGNPDYMFAFKIPTESFKTKVIDIEWNVSKWGQLKPVVLVEPVKYEGITMTRATAHNAKYVFENFLGPGAVVQITRSKEVIPYIVSVVKPADEPRMPEVEYVWDKNKVNISVKKYDDLMCVKLISGFFAKLGIKHVSEATVSKLFAAGLDNLIKIISADKKKLSKVPEFGEKSVDRIYTNIRNGLQNIKLSTVIGASGVLGFGIGERRMEALFLDIPDILAKSKTMTVSQMRDEIMKVEGFSYITASKIAPNLRYANLFIERLGKYATFQTNSRVSNSLIGQKIVMTGFRDKKLEDDIASRGGKVVGSVSKNTTALIVARKNNALTGKSQKAHELKIPIYEKAEFIKEFIS